MNVQQLIRNEKKKNEIRIIIIIHGLQLFCDFDEVGIALNKFIERKREGGGEKKKINLWLLFILWPLNVINNVRRVAICLPPSK